VGGSGSNLLTRGDGTSEQGSGGSGVGGGEGIDNASAGPVGAYEVCVCVCVCVWMRVHTYIDEGGVGGQTLSTITTLATDLN